MDPRTAVSSLMKYMVKGSLDQELHMILSNIKINPTPNIQEIREQLGKSRPPKERDREERDSYVILPSMKNYSSSLLKSAKFLTKYDTSLGTHASPSLKILSRRKSSAYQFHPYVLNHSHTPGTSSVRKLLEETIPEIERHSEMEKQRVYSNIMHEKTMLKIKRLKDSEKGQAESKPPHIVYHPLVFDNPFINMYAEQTSVLSNLLPAETSGVSVMRLNVSNAYVESHQTNERAAVIRGVLVYYTKSNIIQRGNVCPGQGHTLALVFYPRSISWKEECTLSFSAVKRMIDSYQSVEELSLTRSQIQPAQEGTITFSMIMDVLRQRGIVELLDWGV